MSAERVCKKKYYGIACDLPCCLPQVTPPPPPRLSQEWHATVRRWEDLPTLGEAVCRGVFGLGKTCVLRAGHAGNHCSRTGTEWPVESLAGRGEGYG